MNAGKSIKMAMAKRDMTPKDLADRMDVSRQYVGQLMNSEHIGMGTLSSLAVIFDMKVSEFVRLGEDD